MGELKFHWTNPKFEGLDWLIDNPEVGHINEPAQKKKRKEPKPCIRKPYSREDTAKDVVELNAEGNRSRWSSYRCSYCGSFHLWRKKRR